MLLVVGLLANFINIIIKKSHIGRTKCGGLWRFKRYVCILMHNKKTYLSINTTTMYHHHHRQQHLAQWDRCDGCQSRVVIVASTSSRYIQIIPVVTAHARRACTFIMRTQNNTHNIYILEYAVRKSDQHGEYKWSARPTSMPACSAPRAHAIDISEWWVWFVGGRWAHDQPSCRCAIYAAAYEIRTLEIIVTD